MNKIEEILMRMPAVSHPKRKVSFTDKLKWTGIVVLFYFILTNIQLMGLQSAFSLGSFRGLLAGRMGSVLQLGIGPIVTASIVLQLLEGDFIPIDTTEEHGQAIHQGLQKVFVFFFALLTAVPMVLMGFKATPSAIATFGKPLIYTIMIAEIVAGSVVLVYLDEIISKWGIHRGISIFIMASLSQSIFGGLLGQVFPDWFSIATGTAGVVWTINNLWGILIGSPTHLLAIIATVAILIGVVYAESIRVTVPLSRENIKAGQGGEYPIKLIYASVLPIILVQALVANLQFMGRMLHETMGKSLPDIIGVYSQNQPVSGLLYYMSPIRQPEGWMWWLGATTATPTEIFVRIMANLLIFVVGSAVFAVFWINSTGMSAEEKAREISKSKFNIPGFRNNPKILSRVFGRYIPYVTILGGAIIGFLAVLANLLGTVGNVSGTGLLLAVSISYQLYDDVKDELTINEVIKLKNKFS